MVGSGESGPKKDWRWSAEQLWATLSALAAGLLDTSVFIARESGRLLGELPDRGAVSVVSIGELQLGVLNAADDVVRARQADTLSLARSAEPIAISEAVMVSWARVVADCQSSACTASSSSPTR